MIYVLDSNTISFMLDGDRNVIARYRRESDKGSVVIIPPVVYYEVQRGLLAAKLNKKLMQFDILCREIEQPEFEKRVWRKAAEIWATLRQTGKTLDDDGDIFIAAYCLVNNYPLVTNNTKDFERIDGMTLIDWKE